MLMEPSALALGLVWYVVFLFSTTCHEAAHALAAKLGGDLCLPRWPDLTRRDPTCAAGAVRDDSLFPILSYAFGGWMTGWASAPYDPYWADRNPRRAAWMSLAGPAANFTLAILACVVMHIGIGTGAFTLSDEGGVTGIVQGADGVASGLATLTSLMFSLNLLLGTFNLVPIPPLDGHSVLGLFVSEDHARRLQEFERSIRGFSYAGLLVGWKVFDPIFAPIYSASLNAVYIWHA